MLPPADRQKPTTAHPPRRSERHLEVNIGAEAQELAEVRVPEDGAPLAGPVLGDAGLERGLFLRRPALLRRPHPRQIETKEPSPEDPTASGVRARARSSLIGRCTQGGGSISIRTGIPGGIPVQDPGAAGVSGGDRGQRGIVKRGGGEGSRAA